MEPLKSGHEEKLGALYRTNSVLLLLKVLLLLLLLLLYYY